MRKILSFLFIILMGFSLLSCNFDVDLDDVLPNINNNDDDEDDKLLQEVKGVLLELYDINVENTPEDYSRIGKYKGCEITWEVLISKGSSNDVKVIVNQDGTYTIDVNENPMDEIVYILRAKITTPNGASDTLEYNYKIFNSVNEPDNKDDDHDYGNPEVSYTDGLLVLVYTCVDCGHIKRIEQVVDSQINNAVEWNQLFENFTLNNFSLKIYGGGRENPYQINESIVTEDAVYMHMPGGDENYAVKVDDYYIVYTFDYDNNSFSTVTGDVAKNYFVGMKNESILQISFSNNFDKFTYNPATATYYCAETIPATYFDENGEVAGTLYCFNNEIKVVDGKISYISCDYEINLEEEFYSFIYYNIGLSEVVVPQSVIDGNPSEESLLLSGAIHSLLELYDDYYNETTSDYLRIGTINGCNIEWSVKVDCGLDTDVKILENNDGTYTINVNEKPASRVEYTLSAIITTPNGLVTRISYYYIIPKYVEKVEVVYDGVYDDSFVEITFYHTMGTLMRDVLEEGIKDFNKLYPNIKVKHEQIGGYDDVKHQILDELLYGQSPNIAYCYPEHVALYNSVNAVVILDSLISNENIVYRADGSTEILGLSPEQQYDFIQGFYEDGRMYGDGKMYTLPFSKSTEVLYYNKTIFEKYNIDVPDHWFSVDAYDKTSVEYVCKIIKEIDPNSIPFGYDSEANLFITLCEQFGSPYLSATGEHFLFDNDINKNFCKQFRSWYTQGLMITQGLYGSYLSGLFIAEKDTKCYMSIGSSAGARHHLPAMVNGSYPFEVGIAPIPQVNVNNPKVVSQGPSLCIFQKENPQEVYASWLFMEFLSTNVEFQALFSMASGYVPVIQSVVENEIYKSFLEKADSRENINALAILKCLEQSHAYFTAPAFAGSDAARVEFYTLLINILLAQTNDEDKMIDEAFANAIENCKFFS